MAGGGIPLIRHWWWGTAAGGGGGIIPIGGDDMAIEKLYAGARTSTTDYTGSPILNAQGTILLPSDPDFMLVTGAYSLLSGSTAVTTGFFESMYVGGDSHVLAVFGNISWQEFANIDGTSSSSSIGILTDSSENTNAFTLEYTPSNRTISILAVNTPPSNYIPVVTRLLILGD